MAENRTTFAIETSRLVRYLRLRSCLPLLIPLVLTVWIAISAPRLTVTNPWMLSILGIGGIGVAFAVVVTPIQVRAMSYWIDGTTLRIDQGIVVRRCKSIPLDRVTDIEMVQGPLMRVCGIWALQIQTAGSAQQAPEGTIRGVSNPESVRDTIMTIRDQAASKADAAT
ncbi:MAG: PH domain-containing protein [Planctomycetes bacterium]|nr:PH domain-containing protein [Planctomycetota bacterium]MBL7037817.1 PH domain-containing protein [Pirellulaceae bacterium]